MYGRIWICLLHMGCNMIYINYLLSTEDIKVLVNGDQVDNNYMKHQNNKMFVYRFTNSR